MQSAGAGGGALFLVKMIAGSLGAAGAWAPVAAMRLFTMFKKA